jgi:hypothetical protein
MAIYLAQSRNATHHAQLSIAPVNIREESGHSPAADRNDRCQHRDYSNTGRDFDRLRDDSKTMRPCHSNHIDRQLRRYVLAAIARVSTSEGTLARKSARRGKHLFSRMHFYARDDDALRPPVIMAVTSRFLYFVGELTPSANMISKPPPNMRNRITVATAI